VRELNLIHHIHLDAVATGDTNEKTLWHLVECALTWSRVASHLVRHAAVMRAHLDLITSLVTRYGRTGRIVFTGPEYQQAKHGVNVMNELATCTDLATAQEAAEWSRRRVPELMNQHKQQEPACA
jgi:hypothetical protein